MAPLKEAITELVEIAERAAGQGTIDTLCTRLAAHLGVDICSIYVRERDGERRVGGELVLRATHGQPAALVGRVRMRVGEGLTGFAVDCLRPVTVARAQRDARNRAFDGIDEDEHPGFLALPLLDAGTALGAMVLQRKEARAFVPAEIVFAQALSVVVVHALERVRALTPAAAQAASRRPTEVTLRGTVGAPGATLGTAVVRERTRAAASRSGPIDPAEERTRLGRAIAETAEEIAALEAWATVEAPLDASTMRALLASSRYVLDDARLRGRMLRAVQDGLAAERAVEMVIAEYARNLGASGDAALLERALEVEALGLRVCARLDGRQSAFQPGAVLCAARVTACDVLELAAHHGVGILIEGTAQASPGLPIALALRLPALCGIGELFRWVGDGDRVLLRADEGVAVLNPSRVDVAAFRRT